MECKNCPYIKNEFNEMVNVHYTNLANFRKMHPDIPRHPNPYYSWSEDKILSDKEKHCWCDKIGLHIGAYGDYQCEDTYSKILIYKNHSKQKRRNKRERDQKHNNHLKFLAENVPGYPAPAIYTNEFWIRGQDYVQNPKPYYKRLYRGRGKGMSYYHKKISNKKIRRYKGELPKKGNLAHRLYDFWWELT